MRYAFDAYWYVALGCAAIVLFIIIQYLSALIALVWGAYKGRASRKRAVERLRNHNREQSSEPQRVVSPEVPLPVSAEVQAIVERGEPPETQPVVSTEAPLPVSAEVQPIVERAAPPEGQPVGSTEAPLPVSAEVQPIVEHVEPQEGQPVVSTEVPLPVSAEVQAIVDRGEAPEVQPVVSTEAPLPVSAEVQSLLDHAEPPQPDQAVSLDLPLHLSAEARPILEHAEPPQPDLAVSLDLPLPVSAEVQPVLEHAEPKEVQPVAEPPEAPLVVSTEAPLPVGAEVQPIVEHAEPQQPDPAVSLDLPPPARSTEVEPILKQAEPPELPAASGNVYTARKDYDGATAKYDEAIKLDPKFAVTHENHSLTTSKMGKGSIGVTVRRVTDGAAYALNITPARGALVVEIDQNGPAKAAGIEPHDVIVRVDGKDVEEWRDLPRIVADTPVGKDVAVTIIRKSKEFTKTVKVSPLEDADRQASFASQKWSAPQENPVAADRKFETADKHLAEVQRQPASSAPLPFVPPAPPRFGKRHVDRFSKASH